MKTTADEMMRQILDCEVKMDAGKMMQQLLDYDGPRLFFTVGLPRSGKSTYASRWSMGVEAPDVPLLRRAVWNSDSLRLAMGGRRYTRTMEPMVHTFN